MSDLSNTSLEDLERQADEEFDQDLAAYIEEFTDNMRRGLEAEEEEGDEATVPPNLRTATGDRNCSNCSYYLVDQVARANVGTCMMFGGYPVKAAQVCDDWTDEPMDEDEEDE